MATHSACIGDDGDTCEPDCHCRRVAATVLNVADARGFRMHAITEDWIMAERERWEARTLEMRNILFTLSCVDFDNFTEHDEALLEDALNGTAAVLLDTPPAAIRKGEA